MCVRKKIEISYSIPDKCNQKTSLTRKINKIRERERATKHLDLKAKILKPFHIYTYFLSCCLGNYELCKFF